MTTRVTTEPFDSLGHLLEYRARVTADTAAFEFGGERTTYAELFERASRTASGLRGLGVEAGDRVVLAIPNGAEFFDVFYGILLTGAVAAPVFPGTGPERVFRIARHCGAKAVVIDSSLGEADLAAYVEAGQADQRPTLRGREVLADGLPAADELPAVERGDLAFLQYTSGSTGNPKGVELTHGGLLDNVGQMIERWGFTADDVFVSWLPVYHDLGLIYHTMIPFYLACGLVLLPTSLTNVKDWLSAIEKHRATYTGAPDFAYRVCLRYVRNPDSYDLSSLRMALNAAEPVRARTCREFERMFGLKNVMVPAYGLAEATVGVSGWPAGTPIKEDARGLVSVGPPFKDVLLRIVDEDDRELPPGELGEITIKSIANCRGYFNNAEATAALFLEGGYLRTGDVGYVDEEGHLFIAGRMKNVILSGGRTIANQEVEELVDAHPAVKVSAALGVDPGNVDGEQVYVFAEVRKAQALSEQELDEIGGELVERVQQGLGLRPGRVFLVRNSTVPRTYNGKIQHRLLKERLLAGELDSAVLHRIPRA